MRFDKISTLPGFLKICYKISLTRIICFFFLFFFKLQRNFSVSSDRVVQVLFLINQSVFFLLSSFKHILIRFQLTTAGIIIVRNQINASFTNTRRLSSVSSIPSSISHPPSLVSVQINYPKLNFRPTKGATRPES